MKSSTRAPGGRARRIGTFYSRSTVTLFLAAAAVAASASRALNAYFMDSRDAFMRWELWRPFTGHLAHGSIAHLVLDLALFFPLALWRERKVGSRRFLLECGILAAAVAVGVRLLHPDWRTYRGLSGIDYGLLVLALLPARAGPTAGRAGAFAGSAIVIVLSVKTLLELASGGWTFQRHALEETLGVVLLPGSHVAGMAAGAAIWLCGRLAPLRHPGPSQAARNSLVTASGSGASRIAPITATPAAPASLAGTARSGVMPPRA